MKSYIDRKIILLLTVAVLAFGGFRVVKSAFNEQINYQGKLTDTGGIAVPNGSYNLRFRLCTASDCSGGVVWTETLCYSPDSGSTCDGTGTDQRVSVASGLFSILLGNVSSLSSVDFNQTLYLEVQVGGSGATPSWETLTPRKKLGAVPAAIEAKKLGGATWASPSAIGSTTPNSGAFTGLTSSGNSNLASTAGSTFAFGNSAGVATLQSGGASSWTNTAGTLGLTSTGALNLSAGAASTVTLANIANALNFDSDTLTVDALNNRVGIGTAAPGYNFTVNAGGAAGAMQIINNNTGSSTSDGFVIDLETNNDAYVIQRENSDLYFRTNNTNRMMIDNGGDVGIGTVAPGAKLDISGHTRTSSISIQGGGTYEAGSVYSDVNWGMLFRAKQASPVVAEFSFAKSDDTKLLTILSSGNVGIGTATPGAKLSFGAGSGDLVYLYESGADKYGLGIGAGKIQIFGGTGGDIQFLTGGSSGTNLMYLNDNGNVGINTTGPDRRFDVLDASNPQMRLTQTDGTTYADMQVDSSGDLLMNVDGVSNQLVLDNGGNVGIGTATPAAGLAVGIVTATGQIASHLTSTTGAFQLITDSGSKDWALGVLDSSSALTFFEDRNPAQAGTERMRIAAGGNVGIGDTSPVSTLTVGDGDKFQVAGATGNITTAGDLAVNGGDITSTGTLNLSAASASTVTIANVVNALNFDSDTLTIDALNNRVGIGTNAPGAKLTIQSGTEYLNILPDSPTNYVTLYSPASHLRLRSGGLLDMKVWSVADNFIFYNQALSDSEADDVELVRLTGAGNLGIGTTSPAGKLTVAQGTAGVGTVSNSAGGTTVTGVNTQFLNTFKVGDTITINGETVAISAIASDTSMTTAAITNANSGVAYTLTGGTRMVVQGNGNVGIGTATPGARLTVSNNISTLPAPNSDAVLHLSNADSLGSRIVLDSYGSNPIFTFRRANGTAASPTAVLQNEYIGTVAGFGYATTGFSSSGRAQMLFSAAENWTDIAQGAFITFRTTSIGSAAIAERVRITDSGNVGIGDTTPASMLTVGNGDLFQVNSSGAIAAATGIASSGNIDLSSLSAGGLVQAAAGTGRLSIATGGTDFENPLTFNNGLTRTTNTVKLGGTLTANTDVPLGGFNLTFSGSGNVGIGTTSPISKSHISLDGTSPNAGLYAGAEAQTLTGNTGTYVRIIGASDTANASPALVFTRAKGTVASPTIVSSGDDLGYIVAQGFDGSSRRNAAQILLSVDGTPGSSDMPGRIAFLTTPDGSSTLTERMRIDSSGNVGIGTTTPTGKLTVAQGTAGVGTVSNSAGGTTVTGVNTQFLNTFKVGDTITINGETVAISAIASDTSMTTAAITNANSGVAYTLTGGTRMVVQGNGNVGIGTATPLGALSIKTRTVFNEASNYALYGYNFYYDGISWTRVNTSEAGVNFHFSPTTSTEFRFNRIEADGSNTRNLAVLGSGTSYISEGNFGVGDITPDGKLDVESTGAVTASNYGINLSNLTTNATTDGINKYGAYLTSTGAFTGGAGTSTNNYGLYVDTVSGADNNYGAYFANNVGIGTTNPAISLLTVSGTSPASVYAGQIGITGSETTGAADTGGAIYMTGHDGSVTRGWAYIRGMKENSTVGNVASYVSFGTRIAGGALAEKMRIDSAGNVGISTTGPDRKLDVLDATNPQMRLTQADGATYADFQVDSNGDLKMNVDGVSNQLVLDNGGNIGVGTAAPTTIIDVSNNIDNLSAVKLTNTSVGSSAQTVFQATTDEGSVYFGASNSGYTTPKALVWSAIPNRDLVFGVNGSEKARITSAGNVGINTTGPDRRFDVLDTTNPQMRLTQTDGTTYADMQVDSNGDLIMNVDGRTNQLVLDDGGNVGIGTTTPAYLLDAIKNQDGNTTMSVKNSTAGASAQANVSVRNDGNLLNEIGIFSSATTAYGSISTNESYLYTNTAGLSIMVNNASGTIKFATGGSSEKMRIDNAGKVGIGTTSPQYTLDVQGDISSSTAIRDAISWVQNQGGIEKLKLAYNNGSFGVGATPGNITMQADHFSFFDTTTVNANSKGFTGAIFDGRYIYFVPYTNGSSFGQVTRYDTTASFSTAGSWSVFDTTTVNANSKGFLGGVFDGRYIYLVPFLKDGASHGQVTRYDTTASFTAAGSWSVFDTATVNANSKGFTSGVFDGRYVYLVPYSNGAQFGQVTRYDTTASFTAAGSWSVFDTTTVNANSKGFLGGVFDGRYVYFVPFNNGSPFGQVTRYDTTASFTAAGSWGVFDTTTVNANSKGFAGGVFDGRYVYLVPYSNGAQFGQVTRYDTTASFTVAGSWSVFDTTTVNANSKGFLGGVFDGRYLYLVPDTNGAAFGQVTRYDSTGAFTTANSWSVFDTATVNANSKGFYGAAFDGRYIYLAPYDNGAKFGQVTRMFAWAGGIDSTTSLNKIARGGDLYIDSTGNVGIGTTSPGAKLDVSASSAVGVRSLSTATLGASSGGGVLLATTNIPTAADQRLGTFVAGGITTGTTYSYPARMNAYSSQAWSATASGAYLSFLTTANDTLTLSERMRITDAGKIGIGTTDPGNSKVLILAGDSGDMTLTLQENAAANNARFDLRRSQGSSSTPTIVSSGDYAGAVRFSGYDGANYLVSSTIRGEIDGTPGTNDMPGRLVFLTTADGASAATERMRIDNAGYVGIGTTAPTRRLHLENLTAGTNSVSSTFLLNTRSTGDMTDGFGGGMLFGINDDTLSGENLIATIYGLRSGADNSGSLTFNTYNSGTRSEWMRINNAGNVGIGTTSPAYKLDIQKDGDNAIVFTTAYGATMAGSFYGASARGTQASPSASQLNDYLGVFGAKGYGATAFPTWSKAAIFMNAAENWTDAAQGTYMTFNTTATGGTTRTEKMRIDASGNVGIGATSISQLGAGGTPTVLQVHSAGSFGFLGLSTGLTASSSFTGALTFGTTGTSSSEKRSALIASSLTAESSTNVSGDLQFYTNNAGSITQKMVILASGNVGIGATNPTSLLYVQKDQNAGTWTTLRNATSDTGAYEILRLTEDDGNKSLDIFHLNTSFTTSGILTANTSYIDSIDSGGLAVGTRNASGIVKFFTGGLASNNERMRIDSVGNVGIGATSPGYGLDIEKATGNTDAKFGSTLPVYIVHSNPIIGFNTYYDGGWKFGKGSSAQYAGLIGVTPATGEMWFQTSDAGNADAATTVTKRLSILQGGNVGINTAGPDRKLDILDATNPQLRLTQTDGATYADFQVDSNGDLLMNVDGVSNQLVLDNGGNVGIGTASPSEKLHVYGNSTISNALIGTSQGSLDFLGLSLAGVGYNDISSNAYYNGSAWYRRNDSNEAWIISQISTPDNTGSWAIARGGAGTGDMAVLNWAFWIDSYGKTGIGTNAPAEQLTIRQDFVSSTPRNLLGVYDGANNATLAINDGGQTTFKPSAFDKVYTFDGTATYADNTTEAKTSGGTAFNILSSEGSSNDEFYLGLDHPYNTVYFDVVTAGVGVTLSAQYWNGAWTALTITDNTSNLTADGTVTFTAPSDWATTSVNSTTKYWIRLRSSGTNITTAPTAYSVSPTTGNRFYVYGQAGDTNPMLYINDKGSVGIGITSMLDTTRLHAYNASNHITIEAQTNLTDGVANLRLTNDAQIWALNNRGDNGDKFIIRDATGTSYDPLVIEPDAGNNLLYLKSGNVGIGTASPGTELFAWGAGRTIESIKSTASDGGALEMYTSATDASGNYPGQVVFGATAQSDGNKRTAIIASQIVGSTATNRGGNLEFYTKADAGSLGMNMVILNNGDIGIGTSGPESKVQISGGGLCVGSDANCNTDNDTEGVVYSSSTAMTAYDVAENYPTKDATLVPAEVVTLDSSQNGPFVSRGKAGETILGVVSTAPAVLMGGFNGQEYKEEIQVAVALSGRVPVKVSLENGSIEAGDYLTSSSIAGTAAKAIEAGRVIGVALESYDSQETGNIMIFVNPHWYGGELTEDGALANGDGEEIVVALSQSQSFKDLVATTVKEALASLSGTIATAGEWTFGKITTKELCVDDVCVNKSQLQELLNKNQAGSQENIPAGNDQIINSGDNVQNASEYYENNQK